MVCLAIAVVILFSRLLANRVWRIGNQLGVACPSWSSAEGLTPETISTGATSLRSPAQSHQERPPGDCETLSRPLCFARAIGCKRHAGPLVACLDRPECIVWGQGF